MTEISMAFSDTPRELLDSSAPVNGGRHIMGTGSRKILFPN